MKLFLAILVSLIAVTPVFGYFATFKAENDGGWNSGAANNQFEACEFYIKEGIKPLWIGVRVPDLVDIEGGNAILYHINTSSVIGNVSEVSPGNNTFNFTNLDLNNSGHGFYFWMRSPQSSSWTKVHADSQTMPTTSDSITLNACAEGQEPTFNMPTDFDARKNQNQNRGLSRVMAENDTTPVPPTITLSLPTQNSSVDGVVFAFNISGTASSDGTFDGIFVNSTTFYNNSGSNEAWHFINQTKVHEGLYILNITVNDTAGGANYVLLNFTVDYSGPNLTKQPGSQSNAENGVNLVYNLTDVSMIYNVNLSCINASENQVVEHNLTEVNDTKYNFTAFLNWTKYPFDATFNCTLWATDSNLKGNGVMNLKSHIINITKVEEITEESSSGGGGGAAVNQILDKKADECKEYSLELKTAVDAFLLGSTRETTIRLWNAFWAWFFCLTTASVVPST